MSARVSLHDDAGAAAESAEFFRSRAFYDAEGVTHSLVVEAEDGRAALPLVVRPIEDGGELRDATSPYGYPGAEVSGASPDPGRADWAAARLVSLFVRDRLGEPRALAGGTERSVVQISDPELPRKSRMSDRQQIRRNEARGLTVREVQGPRSSPDERAAFNAVYEQTMRGVGASERYFFGREYFDSLLSSERCWLFLCETPAGDVAAAALAALSDGFVHYYLSGTAEEERRSAPSKNLIEAVIAFAEERGAPMNLGGGLRPGDGLEEFKRGFANRELPFVTHEVVCDPAAYRRLSAGRADNGYFPLYRASG